MSHYLKAIAGANQLHRVEGDLNVSGYASAPLDSTGILFDLMCPADSPHGRVTGVYVVAGLDFRPTNLGFFGTFSMSSAEFVYLIDYVPVSIPKTHDGIANVFVKDLRFKFGGRLRDKVAKISRGWRFVVQAALCYEDGSVRLTNWDFFDVTEATDEEGDD